MCPPAASKQPVPPRNQHSPLPPNVPSPLASSQMGRGGTAAASLESDIVPPTMRRTIAGERRGGSCLLLSQLHAQAVALADQQAACSAPASCSPLSLPPSTPPFIRCPAVYEAGRALTGYLLPDFDEIQRVGGCAWRGGRSAGMRGCWGACACSGCPLCLSQRLADPLPPTALSTAPPLRCRCARAAWLRATPTSSLVRRRWRAAS